MTRAALNRSPERRAVGEPRRAVLTLRWAVVIALVAAGLVLLSPLPSPEQEAALCMHSQRIAGSWLGYPLNCDSPLFVRTALDPSQLVTTDHPFQSRPLYFAVPAAVGATGSGELVFRTYQAMNIAFLALAVWVLGRLVGGPQRGWLLVLPLFLLSDIVKAFVWTPHTQILNIAVPIMGMWLLLTMSPGRRVRWFALAGLAAGLGILVYGAVIPVVAAGLLRMAWERGRYRVQQGAAFAAMAALPTALWIAAVVAWRGTFYSHETVTYRQVVWLADLDPGAVMSNTTAWVRSVAAAATLTAVVAGMGLLLAWRQGWRPEPDLWRAATALTVVTAAFTWSLGFPPQRLTWVVVVPLLVVTAAALSSVALPRWHAVAYGVAVGTWSLRQVLVAGPWA